MTETVPFDAIVGFGAGAIMALVCRQPLLEVEDPLRNRYVAVVLMFACGGLMPAGLVFYVQHPDWSLMYMANPEHIPQLLFTPLIMSIYASAPVLGFITMCMGFRSGWKNIVPLILGLTSLSLLTLLIWGWDRLFSVGYYNDYHYKGQILHLFDSKLIWTVVGIALVVGGLFAYCLAILKGHILELNDSAVQEESKTAELAAESPTLPPH